MHLHLHLTAPDNTTTVIDAARCGLPVVLGRDSELANVPILDTQASRRHCAIERNATGILVVRDLDSRNGTWVNGRQVPLMALHHGDCIRIGHTHITVEIDPERPIELLLGQILGGYELHEIIGKGSFGTVFRATQLAMNRVVGIKVLARERSSDPKVVNEFVSEARRAGRLNHPNLVHVHDVLQVGSHHLLVMELMAGSATDHLRERGPMDEHTALTVLAHIAKALAYAETQRIVHRDVKPDNILVNDQGVYKLADLGIAMTLAADGQAHQERSVGSPHYVAPEQARGGAIDGRADLYALGASIWHLVTGQTIYSGTTAELVRQHLHAPVPDLAALEPGLSRSFVALVTSLLAKSPDERPAHALEVVNAANILLERPPLRLRTRPPLRRVR